MDCYSCDQPATNACKRCSKPYCEAHGNAAFCSECLHPASAMPSFNLYRGALLTMLVGTALAVFLILRPPAESKGAAPVIVGRSTPTATNGGQAQATVPARTPAASTTADATAETTGTPQAGETTTPGATVSATQSPFGEHVVVEGDTLFGIAQANLTPGDNIDAFTRAIATLNGIDINNPVLNIGQTILLPKRP
ncbi:MAG: LysM peptidoglycan-binding domain-containing protein [Chloroflexi bacterium]|nr:LysM peptidoglycan-binding domain-containing protein [Chloroflexota bacterium]